jgi:deoxycytidine triphosphate deaminase
MSVVVVNTPESNTHITNIDDDCVQQAAVDLRLERMWGMNGPFTIDEEQKQHRNKYELSVDDEGYYNLEPGVYECSFDHDIKMGDDEVALIVTRSTLIRNGIFIASGLWDPSFRGKGGCCLHVHGGPAKIKPNTRIGQYLVWKVANAQGQYDGDYGLDRNGQAKEMEKRYYS